MRVRTIPFLLVLPLVAHSQSYLTEDPVWQVRSICAVPQPCIATDLYNYTTSGDSLINGVLWTKVVRQGTVSDQWQGPPPAPLDCQGSMSYGPELFGIYLVRQEQRQLRIWVNDADELLHEFDLVLGSTLPITYTNWNDDITVIGVDSVLVGSAMRARYELDNSWSQYLVEGMGSTHGLFEPISNFFDCGYELFCFGLGDAAFYPSAGPSCLLPMSLAEVQTSELTLGPVPVNDMLRITSVSPLGDIVVHDASGREVHRSAVANNTAEIDLQGLNNGSYVVRSGSGIPQRFIVAH